MPLAQQRSYLLVVVRVLFPAACAKPAVHSNPNTAGMLCSFGAHLLDHGKGLGCGWCFRCIPHALEDFVFSLDEDLVVVKRFIFVLGVGLFVCWLKGRRWNYDILFGTVWLHRSHNTGFRGAIPLECNANKENWEKATTNGAHLKFQEKWNT